MTDYKELIKKYKKKDFFLAQMVWLISEKEKVFLVFLGNNLEIFSYSRRRIDAENIVTSQWGCECVFAGDEFGSKGVAIRFKNDLEYKIHNVSKDDEGRYVLIDIALVNKHFALANVNYSG